MRFRWLVSTANCTRALPQTLLLETLCHMFHLTSKSGFEPISNLATYRIVRVWIDTSARRKVSTQPFAGMRSIAIGAANVINEERQKAPEAGTISYLLG